MGLIAALTAPPGLILNNFFVAAFQAAGQIDCVILLDIDNYSTYAKIVRHFAYTQVLFLDLRDKLELVIVCAAAAKRGIYSKYIVIILRNVPVF